MMKGRKEVKSRVNRNLNKEVKGGLVMSRKILAGLLVLAFVLVGTSALADNSVPLSYQVIPSKTSNTTVVKLYLENSKGMAGASIPISFAAPGADVMCTKISFEGSRVSHFMGKYPNIDNTNNKVLIGLIRALDENISDVLPAGEGLVATLYFESQEGLCVPELKLTSWQLSAGELHFELVDETGHCTTKIKTKGQDVAIPQVAGGSTGINDVTPSHFELKGNYPNPFNPETIIGFNLPQQTPVTLRVYNILGQVVNTLVDEVLPAGNHAVKWDGTNDGGKEVASGVYFYRIKAGDFESTQKMTLLR
jgi:hypothetical protein